MASGWHPKQELEALGGQRPRPPKRAVRVADVIREELSILLVERVRDPQLQAVSFTRVDLSDDLRHAKIYYTLYRGRGDRDRVADSLAKAAGFMRTHLAKTLNLRFTPELRFWYDERLEQAEQMEQLLDDLARERDGRDEDS